MATAQKGALKRMSSFASVPTT